MIYRIGTAGDWMWHSPRETPLSGATAGIGLTRIETSPELFVAFSRRLASEPDTNLKNLLLEKNRLEKQNFRRQVYTVRGRSGL